MSGVNGTNGAAAVSNDASKTAAAATDETPNNSSVLDKYKEAAKISGAALKAVIDLIAQDNGSGGLKLIDLCQKGDEAIETGAKGVYNKVKGMSKGIAFPTCISINHIVCHCAPLPEDPAASTTLKEGDMVKIQLGAQIDGYASIVADTVIVGSLPSQSSPTTVRGTKADAVVAAYQAAELASRLIKPGAKNSDVTEAVTKLLADFDCKSLEGFLAYSQERNVVDGKKKIIFGPNDAQKREFETCTFEEGDVWGVDILVTSGSDPKTKPDPTRTTVYKRNAGTSYQLKMKTSRSLFSEVQKKAGAFPFNLRIIEDAKKARMGASECVGHGLITGYDVQQSKEGDAVAQIFFTLALTKTGAIRLTPPPVYASKPDLFASEKSVRDEEVKKLLSAELKPSKKNKKKGGDAVGDAKA